MAAIWHDTGVPGWLSPKPQFSFHEMAEIHIPAPENYAHAMQEFNRKYAEVHMIYVLQGEVVWQRKRPWYCYL